MIDGWQTTSSERCTWDIRICVRASKSSVSSLRVVPRLCATTKKRIPTVPVAVLVDAVRGTVEVAEEVDIDDEVEDGKWPFSSEFLVSGSGLLHSAGVLYVQVGGDWKLLAMRSIYPCLLYEIFHK